MNKIVSLLFLLLLTLVTRVVYAQAPQLMLMPYPKNVQVMEGSSHLSKKMVLSIKGMSVARASFFEQRIQQQLASVGYTLVAPKLNVANSSTSHSSKNTFISITVKENQHSHGLPHLYQPEAYQLIVNDKGISLQAESDFGAIQGISTLLQLFTNIPSSSSAGNVSLPWMKISDSPRFPWRGLLIDSVRHFLPISTIKRQIDGMFAAKINVFHWHLTDDQGWRYESKAYPKLHQQASDGQYYTQAEIKDVVKYASLLGIRVVPEFDVPGHASAIAVAYPELITENKSYEMEDHWGVFEPLLDPSNPNVYKFIDQMVAELTTLFPDAYLHIGGDEVNPKQWENSEKVRAYMNEKNIKDAHELHVYFNQRVQKILAKHQRKMMGWDEIFHPQLPKNIMVQSWRGMESLSEIASTGFQGLLSTGFYIDQPQSTAYHYRNEPLTQRPKTTIKPQVSDKISAWSFTMPRLKGSAVKGTLALVSRNNYFIHGYLKLNNNHFQKVTIDRRLSMNLQQINVSIDSWMGPTRAEFDLSDPEQLSGRMLIGNTHYDVEGSELTEFDYNSITLLANVPKENEKNILGGEATMWSEMVTDKNVDLRIWPRTFAIAERFWSPKTRNNPEQMYQRLLVMDKYAAFIGLHHQKQFNEGIQGLVFPNTDIAPLLLLSQQLEPANYYTRHHLKFQQDKYHQNASLNLFVDYLPVESFTLIKMEQQLQRFKQGDKTGLQSIINTLRKWHYNFDKAEAIVKKNPKLSTLRKVVRDARKINTIGLTIAQSCVTGVKIRGEEAKRIKAKLMAIHSNVREVVVASGLFTENLLQECR